MNSKYLFISTIIIVVFLSFFSGIYRHDVKEAKYLKLAAEKQFDCVVQLHNDTSVDANGVLISQYHILSAAHCFIESDYKTDTIEVDGVVVTNYVSYNPRIADPQNLHFEENGKRIAVKRIILHPFYLDSLTKGSCDLAIIELEEGVTSIIPATINTAFNELHSEVVGVGYGASGPASKPEQVGLYNKKIAGENVIDSIGGPEYLGMRTVMYTDFDCSGIENCNKMGSAVPRKMEYAAAGGDSGSGVFRKNGKSWELIGITSGGDGIDLRQFLKSYYYCQISGYTRTSVFADWINENMKQE